MPPIAARSAPARVLSKSPRTCPTAIGAACSRMRGATSGRSRRMCVWQPGPRDKRLADRVPCRDRPGRGARPGGDPAVLADWRDRMSIESPSDWQGLEQAARVARLTLEALVPHVRPGITTGELDAEAE